MSLENWVTNSWLERRDTDAKVIGRLFALADGRLEDYKRAVAGTLSPDFHAYACVLVGAPEGCGSEHDLNFVAARMPVFPPNVRELLERLHISPNREVDIYHTARLASGRHLYGGWFHFIGFSAADAARQVAENRWKPDLELANENLSLGFSS